METYTISFDNYQQALSLCEELKKDFPNCFFPLGQERPLKIKIYEDLMKIEKYRLQKFILKDFFKIYTNSVSYRACLLTKEATRVDLNGNETGKVFQKKKFAAKTRSVTILFELDTEGYDQKRIVAEQLKEFSEVTKETICELFKMPKIKKPAAAKQVKPPKQPKVKQAPPPPKPKKKPRLPKSTEPKKPVLVIIKKKRKFTPEP